MRGGEDKENFTLWKRHWIEKTALAPEIVRRPEETRERERERDNTGRGESGFPFLSLRFPFTLRRQGTMSVGLFDGSLLRFMSFSRNTMSK